MNDPAFTVMPAPGDGKWGFSRSLGRYTGRMGPPLAYRDLAVSRPSTFLETPALFSLARLRPHLGRGPWRASCAQAEFLSCQHWLPWARRRCAPTRAAELLRLDAPIVPHGAQGVTLAAFGGRKRTSHIFSSRLLVGTGWYVDPLGRANGMRYDSKRLVEPGGPSRNPIENGSRARFTDGADNLPASPPKASGST